MEHPQHIPIAKYPVLQKAFNAAPEEFRMLQAAYTREELHEHEERLSTKWNANFLPKLVAEAKQRLDEKEARRKMVRLAFLG